MEIRVSYEAGRMLGSGRIIGRSSSPSHPFLNSALSDSIGECETVSYLNDAVKHFQLVLDQCPVCHPHQAATLANLVWARLESYIQNELRDIDLITSLFHEALAFRPQGHPDHPLSIYHLLKALIRRFSKENTAACVHESAQLYCKFLPLCPEGTYLRGVTVVANGINYVIHSCSNLLKDSCSEGIHLRCVVLEFCPRALYKLAYAVEACFRQHGTIDDLAESIAKGAPAPEGHSERNVCLNNLALSLDYCFNHQGNSHDFKDIIRSISLQCEALM
ncbi:hypothetical protein BDR03DRAFT_1096257 [Suillus americanus]|nr:hypothetical protein BDR03DRAFT_1096257 [Suillus americanus]